MSPDCTKVIQHCKQKHVFLDKGEKVPSKKNKYTSHKKTPNNHDGLLTQQKIEAFINQDLCFTQWACCNFHPFNFTHCKLVKSLNLAPAFSFKCNQCPAAGHAGSLTVRPSCPSTVASKHSLPPYAYFLYDPNSICTSQWPQRCSSPLCWSPRPPSRPPQPSFLKGKWAVRTRGWDGSVLCRARAGQQQSLSWVTAPLLKTTEVLRGFERAINRNHHLNRLWSTGNLCELCCYTSFKIIFQSL